MEKTGQLDTVILSVEHYLALKAQHDKSSRGTRKTAFEAEYGGWIADQNARVETHCIPGSDLRPW